LFCKTNKILNADLVSSVMRYLQVKDTKHDGFSKVVIAAHSPRSDLKALQRLGVDLFGSVAIEAVIDTHAMSKFVFGSRPTTEGPLTRHWGLGAMLTELQCAHDPEQLHNAANDAMHTLQLALKLLNKYTSTQQKLPLRPAEIANFERLIAILTPEL
jgi:DNA polymerase III epsilon subunit-like protein